MREREPLGTILPGLLILTLAISSNVDAQMRVVGVSRPMPAPAFAGLQNLLASPAGMSLLAGNPQLNPLQQIVSMSPSAPGTLQALGPLAANLPADFLARVEAARTSGSAAPLAEVLAQAYADSVPAALAEIDARSLRAVKSAASDANAWRNLGSVASDLKSYSLYGPAARERVVLFAQKAAGVRSQELAKNLSRELQTGLRGPESAGEGILAGSADENSFARRHSRLTKAPSEWDRFSGAPEMKFLKENGPGLRRIPGVQDVSVTRIELVDGVHGRHESQWVIKLTAPEGADLRPIESAVSRSFAYQGIHIVVEAPKQSLVLYEAFNTDGIGLHDGRPERLQPRRPEPYSEPAQNWFDGLIGGPARRFLNAKGPELRSIPGVQDARVSRLELIDGVHGRRAPRWGVTLTAPEGTDIHPIDTALLRSFAHKGMDIVVEVPKQKLVFYEAFGTHGVGVSDSRAQRLRP